ncbi:hypothetical protein BDN71DRAFT_1587896 [Pleurotus eryngii]|uniref:Uncharacterized protein n=1 Tax=Pleurotus eryngii TaxID=5323 RepID=A0A9P6A2Q2_PLEER|nr:hypothetical protein BDN71DRAFT_1587896 [Pleurotus eryngii]
MKEISTMRGPSKFLLNLQCLQFNPSTLDHAGILLHSTVTSLHIVWLWGDSHLVGSLLFSLPTETPRLEELFLRDEFDLNADNIRSRALDANIERVVAATLQKMPSLNRLDLPTRWSTCAIFRAAAISPLLNELCVQRVHSISGEINVSDFEHGALLETLSNCRQNLEDLSLNVG